MNLSIDFAFEGFRIIRQRPWLILFWGVLLLVGNGAVMLVLINMAGPALASLQNPGNSADPSASLAALQQLLPAYGVILPLAILLQSVLSCAIFRAVLEKPSSRFGYVRLGGDEIRLILLYICFVFVMIGAEIVCVGAGAIAGALLGVVLGMVSQTLAAVGMFVGISAGVIALIWVVLRLSLFAVQSFDQKKINLFGSWKLTKGHGWTLFGGYVVSFVMVLLVYLLCLIIFGAIVVGFNGGNFAAMTPVFGKGMTSMAAFMSPVMITYTILMNLFVSPLILAIMVGAPAAAYKALSGTVLKSQIENTF